MRQTFDFAIQELDTVVLARNIPEQGLKQGDVGAVVHCYSDGAAFEIEFVAPAGDTIALLTLSKTDIQPITTHHSPMSNNPKVNEFLL